MKPLRLLPLVAGLLLATSAEGASLPQGVNNGIKVERFTMHSQEGVGWAAEGIRGAKHDVLFEAFDVSNPKIVDATRDRLRSGVKVRAHADPENIGGKSIQSLIRDGADFRPWGGNALKDGVYKVKLNPRKVHAKAVHFDDKSWLSTAPLAWEGVSVDGSAIVKEETAAAARSLTERAYHDDDHGLKVAADSARAHGVLLNAPSANISHLTDGMHDLIKKADKELLIGMKAVESVEFVKWLDQATSRGLKVTLIGRPSKMSKKVQKALKKSDVELVEDENNVLHGNFIVADGAIAIFASAHATNRALGAPARRESYEMGYVVDDAKTVTTISAWLNGFRKPANASASGK